MGIVDPMSDYPAYSECPTAERFACWQINLNCTRGGSGVVNPVSLIEVLNYHLIGELNAATAGAFSYVAGMPLGKQLRAYSG